MTGFFASFVLYLGLVPSLIVNLLRIRTKVYYEDETRQNKKLKGKAIIISNHQHPLDGLVILHKYFFRRIYYIIGDFFKQGFSRLLRIFIRLSGGVIVDRETFSFDFFEQSKRLLNKGKLLLIFPEGRFSYEYEPIRFIYSYLMLALQNDTPIVPVVSDCNYGLKSRTHIIIGNSIEPAKLIDPRDVTKEKLVEMNESIYQKFMELYYELKKRKYAHLSKRYICAAPQAGDMVRIPCGNYYHYGVYLDPERVVQFGRPKNGDNTEICVNAVTLAEFCGDKIPEIRVLARNERKYRRKTKDIIAYALFCIGQKGYNLSTNNCRHFAERVILK